VHCNVIVVVYKNTNYIMQLYSYRAAKESESKVVKLELELATALSKLQAIAEAESDAIKVTPGGQNFK
jgi:hypothetical protein